MGYHWEVLGLEPTGDVLAIKKAYAGLLKQNRPDEQPEAYQALRQAYEWALSEAEWIRQAPQDADQGEEHDPLPEFLLGEDAQVDHPPEALESFGDISFESDRADALLDRWADRLLQCEAYQAEPCWRELSHEIENLPLEEQTAASALFADFVLQHEALHTAVLASMARYFRWGRDYRDAERLGAYRLAQLRERLIQDAPTVLRDAQQVERATEVLRLDWVLQHQGRLSGWLYAALAGPHLGRLIGDSDDRQRRALDIPFLRWEAIRSATSYAGFIRLFFVLACVIPLAYLLIKPEEDLLHWIALPLFFGGAYGFTAWGLGRSLPIAGDEMNKILSRVKWLRTDQDRLVAAIALPVIIALIAHDADAVLALQSVFPDGVLTAAAVLTYVAALLIPVEAPEERQIYLPMLGAFSFGLTGLTGENGAAWVVAMGAASAWIGLGGWVYHRYHEQVIHLYRRPKFFLWLSAVFAFVLAFALPITLRVLARYMSANTVVLAVGVAVALSMLADPGNAAKASLPALALTAAALTGLQALAERLSGRLFRRVPATFFQHDD